MKNMKKSRFLQRIAVTALCVSLLNGCVSYGPAAEPGQTGDYYDQYTPAYGYYPGQAAYPYPPGYGGYPYPPGYYEPYYGPRVIFGPSIYFGAGRGSSGVGVGTTFGF